jgi:hypothetical protein
VNRAIKQKSSCPVSGRGQPETGLALLSACSIEEKVGRNAVRPLTARCGAVSGTRG